MTKAIAARIALVCFVGSMMMGSEGAWAWSGDNPTTTPTTVMGTTDECNTAQNALKKDFDANIEELKEPDPEYQKVSDEIDAYRETMTAKKRFKKIHEDAMAHEADLDEKLTDAFKKKLETTYDLIDRLCITDAASVLYLEQNYYKARYELFRDHAAYLKWVKENWRVFQFTLPRNGKTRYLKWTRTLKTSEKLAERYKELMESMNKETAHSLFTSPVEYPISAI